MESTAALALGPPTGPGDRQGPKGWRSTLGYPDLANWGTPVIMVKMSFCSAGDPTIRPPVAPQFGVPSAALRTRTAPPVAEMEGT